jgi:hypothetical protein
MRSCSVGTSLMNFSPSLMLADGSKGCCKLFQCSSYPCGSAACFSHANVLFNVFLKMDKLCSPVYQRCIA